MTNDHAKLLLLVPLFCLVVGLALVGMAWWGTYSQVGDVADEAMLAYPKADRVDALVAIVEDTSYSLEQRNRAVWALG